MKIVILAPSHKSFISKFLSIPEEHLPDGYDGAPFIGILVQQLLERGHEVIAITTTINEKNKYKTHTFVNNNFKWIVVPARKYTVRFNGFKLGKIIDFFALERAQLKMAIKEQNPDFIHAHWSYEFAGAAHGLNIPYLVTIHDNPYKVVRYMRNVYRMGRLLMAEWVLRKVRFVSTVSPYMSKYAAKRCSNVLVIPNPVSISIDLEKIEETVLSKIESLSCPHIVMVMNGWDDRKNGNNGLKAFQLIKTKFPGAILDLYGVGTERGGPAFKTAKLLGLYDVVFNGVTVHQDLMEAMIKSHLLIHPSYEESFGVVLIEAMSYGVPVIGGINSGAVPWVLNSESLLVDVSNPTHIGERAVELLSDGVRYRQLSIECYNNVCNRFSSDAVTDEYEAYYQRITDNWK